MYKVVALQQSVRAFATCCFAVGLHSIRLHAGTIDKEGNRQKLKSYFINEKIPREEREEMLLIADGPEIVWIPGYRMNCAYYVTDGTERILEIKITEDGTNVRDDQSIDPGRES